MIPRSGSSPFKSPTSHLNGTARLSSSTSHLHGTAHAGTSCPPPPGDSFTIHGQVNKLEKAAMAEAAKLAAEAAKLEKAAKAEAAKLAAEAAKVAAEAAKAAAKAAKVATPIAIGLVCPPAIPVMQAVKWVKDHYDTPIVSSNQHVGVHAGPFGLDVNVTVPQFEEDK